MRKRVIVHEDFSEVFKCVYFVPREKHLVVESLECFVHDFCYWNV